MSINTDNLSVQNIFGLIQKLKPGDQHWLAAQLNRLLSDEDAAPLPESATLDEAIDLYLADKCSLGRAAELAGVTRWELQDVLKERGTPVEIYSGKTVAEMDAHTEDLKRRGILCSS